LLTFNNINQYINITGQLLTYGNNGNFTSDGAFTYSYDDETTSTTGFLYDFDSLVAE
jgi:hypothetical protein